MKTRSSPRSGLDNRHCPVCHRVTVHAVSRTRRKELARCTRCWKGYEIREAAPAHNR